MATRILRTAIDLLVWIFLYKHTHVYDPATIRNKLVMRTGPNRKHEFQIIPNFAKDGVRGVQSKSFFYRCINIWMIYQRKLLTQNQFNPSKDDWTKHGGIILYVLANNFCNFVYKIIKETLNWSEKSNT